jgi:anti-sigma B factor antagonist
MAEAEEIRRTLEELAARCAPVIVLDLSEMDFICSVGLGAIITGHLRSRHHQGEIRLVNPQDNIQDLLHTTKLTKLFAIYPTLEQALAN